MTAHMAGGARSRPGGAVRTYVATFRPRFRHAPHADRTYVRGMEPVRTVLLLIMVMMLTAVTAMMVMVTAVMVTAMMVMVMLTAVMETWLIAWTYVALAAAT